MSQLLDLLGDSQEFGELNRVETALLPSRYNFDQPADRLHLCWSSLSYRDEATRVRHRELVEADMKSGEVVVKELHELLIVLLRKKGPQRRDQPQVPEIRMLEKGTYSKDLFGEFRDGSVRRKR